MSKTSPVMPMMKLMAMTKRQLSLLLGGRPRPRRGRNDYPRGAPAATTGPDPQARRRHLALPAACCSRVPLPWPRLKHQHFRRHQPPHAADERPLGAAPRGRTCKCFGRPSCLPPRRGSTSRAGTAACQAAAATAWLAHVLSRPPSTVHCRTPRTHPHRAVAQSGGTPGARGRRRL